MAKGGDQILEIVPGAIIHNGEKDLSLGLDYEYFPKPEHKYSLGFSFETEFLENREYFFGPHLAWYFYGHNKIFYSSGIGWSENHSFWKNNIGIGHEFIFKNHFVIVPSIIYEHSAEAEHTLIAIGFGFEF